MNSLENNRDKILEEIQKSCYDSIQNNENIKILFIRDTSFSLYYKFRLNELHYLRFRENCVPLEFNPHFQILSFNGPKIFLNN